MKSLINESLIASILSKDINIDEKYLWFQLFNFFPITKKNMNNKNKRNVVAQMVGRDSLEAKEFYRNFWQNAGSGAWFGVS